MKQKKPHLFAAIFTGCYALLVFLAELPNHFPPHDALDGILVVVLCLPWVVFLTIILDAIDPTLVDNQTVMNVGMLVCATMNAVLIYLVTFWIVRAVTRAKDDFR